MICPYCNKEAKWVDNRIIYGKRYGRSYMVWYCKPCDAYAGCHCNTKTPLGTMANAELRKWREKAHAHIDPLWKNGDYTRAEVYNMLKNKLGREIHIGEADIETCKRIIEQAKGQVEK
jgi:tetrahydromethanopterin S-methyltransferase subunit G